jgi:hypothetical protein
MVVLDTVLKNACAAPFYLMAKGLAGEPTAPVTGNAGATNMNS